MTGIKICGLFRAEDIAYVNEALPDYAGFILHFPKSHRNLSVREAAQLRQQLSPAIKAVGVFVSQPLETVVRTASVTGIDIIQLHGNEDNAYIESLRNRCRQMIWKAFRIRSSADLAAAAASAADSILLDNGYGTGEVFDWMLADGFTRPFGLAGGLTPENIPEAVRTLHPQFLDISTGVETEGRKDREKILAAVGAARNSEQIIATAGGTPRLPFTIT